MSWNGVSTARREKAVCVLPLTLLHVFMGSSSLLLGCTAIPPTAPLVCYAIAHRGIIAREISFDIPVTLGITAKKVQVRWPIARRDSFVRTAPPKRSAVRAPIAQHVRLTKRTVPQVRSA